MPPPRFRVARPGYDTAPVDAFIERVAGALESRPVTISAEDVRRARFALAQSRPGYAVPDVDAWMQQIMTLLATAERAARVAEPAAAAGRPVPGGWPPDHAAGRTEPGSGAIEELPATPAWVRVTALLVIVGMLGLFVASYFR